MKLNQAGYRHAMSLIRQGKVNKAADWGISAEDENRILGDPPDWDEYSRWHLAVDTSANEETKERYKYPFGKGGQVYRSALIAIRQRAGQQKEGDVFAAAGRLIEALDGKEKEEAKLYALRTAGELAEAPEWFQLFPYGEVLIEDEEPAIMDEEGAALVLAHFNSLEHDMVIDYEHQTLSGEKAPAAGWIKELEWRDKQGLWARTDWTEEAANYIQKREYRYFSPVFWRRRSDNRIVELYNVALTNQPRMMNVRALAAKCETKTFKHGGDPMFEKLKKLLGLAKEASEEEMVQAVEGLVAKNKELEEAGQVVACKEILEALEVDQSDDKDKVVAKVQELRKAQGKKSDLETELQSLKKDHEALKHKWDERTADELIAKATAKGQITPAQVEEYGREMALKDPERFKKVVLGRREYSEVPLKDLPPEDPDAGGGTPQGKMDRLIAKKQKENKDLSYQDAMNLVAAENPELAESYLEAGRSKG
jgi:phage I-like protein